VNSVTNHPTLFLISTKNTFSRLWTRIVRRIDAFGIPFIGFFLFKWVTFHFFFLSSFRFLVYSCSVASLTEDLQIVITTPIEVSLPFYATHFIFVLLMIALLQPIFNLAGHYVCGWPCYSEFTTGCTWQNYIKYVLRLLLFSLVLSFIIIDVLPVFPMTLHDLHTQYRRLEYPYLCAFPIFDSLLFSFWFTILGACLDVLYARIRFDRFE